MTGDLLFDACRMFKHACGFVDCAIFCERDKKPFSTAVTSHVVASIVNSAFACEVFIKSLLVFYGESIESIKGHELKNLWKRYKTIDGNNAEQVEASVKEIFNSQNNNIFDELLDNISNAFEYWRYIYEKKNGTLNVGFLKVFRDRLRELCCQTFYKKTWSDYMLEKGLLIVEE